MWDEDTEKKMVCVMWCIRSGVSWYKIKLEARRMQLELMEVQLDINNYRVSEVLVARSCLLGTKQLLGSDTPQLEVVVLAGTSTR